MRAVVDASPGWAGGRERPWVAVLAPRRDPPVAAALRDGLPGAHVSTYDTRTAGIERLHVWLAAHGPLDLVVDRDPDDVPERLGRLLLHVRPGGAYVVRDSEGTSAWLRSLVEERDAGARPATPGDPRGAAERDRATLAWSIAEVEPSAGHLVVRHRAEVAATVREQQLGRVLSLRDRDVDVLTTLDAAGPASVPEVRVSPGAEASLLGALDAPEARLSQWRDVVCHAEQVGLERHLLLPSSLPNRTSGRLAHPSLARWAPGFVGRPAAADARDLPGPWYYLDNVQRRHFGHALTEQLSMAWGWSAARDLHPDLRALLLRRPHETEPPGWELDLLEAAGVPRERVELVDGPVRVQTLVTATPLYSRPDWVHPRLAAVHDAVGTHLAARSTTNREWPERVFLTRVPGKRACRNAAEVEDLHRAHGFEVVRPELLPLPDQVRLVREARVVSGFAGSAMFHVALSERPQHVVAIGHEGYPAHNEQMFAALRGHRLDLVLSRPDVPRGERFDRAAFHSSFAVDPQREGAFLREVLAELA